MNEELNLNREGKAVDALITAALHEWQQEEVSEAEIHEFLSSKGELNDAEKAALTRVQEQLLRGDTSSTTSQFSVKPELASSYMAMNRENAKDQLPESAREEIERKRANLLAQLKAKKHPTK